MDPSAHVTAVEALVLFRADLATFLAQAKDALTTLDMDIRRAFQWLDEQKRHWEAAVRQAEDEVFQARNELARRRMMKIGDRTPDTTEQEKALARARARLEHAERKLEATRRWQRTFPDEVDEYHGPSRQLQGLLEADLPRMLAYLESKIASLEAYMGR